MVSDSKDGNGVAAGAWGVALTGASEEALHRTRVLPQAYLPPPPGDHAPPADPGTTPSHAFARSRSRDPAMRALAM